MDEQNWGIVPCSNAIDISHERGLTKLELTSGQKMQVAALLHQLPSVVAAKEMPQFYTVEFPDGLTGKLMELKRGGLTTSVIGENGKIAGTASLHSLAPQAVAIGCFSAMSIASSQYFLKQINDDLKMIRLSLDKILEFLYGEMKAELMAEVSFVKYAYQNFSSIMEHTEQRAAIIESLHNSRKVAIKDIEFYIADLDATIKGKDCKDNNALGGKAFQISETLMLAMQLYGISSLLEVHYAQNYDSGYLKYVENDITAYIDKCEKRMLGSFSELKGAINNPKGILPKVKDKSERKKSDLEKRIDGFVEPLQSGEESEMRRSLRTGLNALTNAAEYYMTNDGTVYLKSM